MSGILSELYPFLGIYNFRDLGGIPIGTNSTTRLSKLYRSDSFDDATEEDIELLFNVIGVRRIIDLRASDEVASIAHSISVPIAGIEYCHRPMDSGQIQVTERIEDILPSRYMSYLEVCTESLVAAIQDLASTPHIPTVIHCRVGKDRTGVLVALVLSLIGVGADLVSADYAKTALAMPKIRIQLAGSSFYAKNLGNLPDEIYSARADTMLRFLALLDEKYGSPLEWALANGIHGDIISKLIANFTEDLVSKEISN